MNALYRHDREVPVGWQAALWTIAPPSEKLSSLLLRWEPGDIWEPVQRWMIWQMRPAHTVRPDVLAELRGPDPRSTGHYCGQGFCICRNKLNKWRGGQARMIDRMQWKLYQETGQYGTRWWTIQGAHGGHRHRLDQIESKVSKLMGGKADTPAPGDLEYAEFDKRTFYKIVDLDRVRAWKHVLSYCDRNHDQMDADEKAAEVETQKLLWDWLKTQSGDALEGISRKEWADFREAAPRPVGGFKDTTDIDEVREAFINNPT